MLVIISSGIFFYTKYKKNKSSSVDNFIFNKPTAEDFLEKEERGNFFLTTENENIKFRTTVDLEISIDDKDYYLCVLIYNSDKQETKNIFEYNKYASKIIIPANYYYNLQIFNIDGFSMINQINEIISKVNFTQVKNLDIDKLEERIIKNKYDLKPLNLSIGINNGLVVQFVYLSSLSKNKLIITTSDEILGYAEAEKDNENGFKNLIEIPAKINFTLEIFDKSININNPIEVDNLMRDKDFFQKFINKNFNIIIFEKSIQ